METEPEGTGLAEEDFSVGQMLVLEYKHLKYEQLARISTRDNLIYVTLASLAAVAAATLQVGTTRLLLLLPPACLILGWTYLVNDQKVSAIGYHIRAVLAPQIGAALDTQTPLFTWEIQHRADTRRRIRKLGQLCVDLITFCIPALAAVVVYAVTEPPAAIFIAVSVIEIIATLLLAWAIVDNADLSRDILVWHPSAPSGSQDDTELRSRPG
jgi:hypothetical protein